MGNKGERAKEKEKERGEQLLVANDGKLGGCAGGEEAIYGNPILAGASSVNLAAAGVNFANEDAPSLSADAGRQEFSRDLLVGRGGGVSTRSGPKRQKEERAVRCLDWSGWRGAARASPEPRQ